MICDLLIGMDFPHCQENNTHARFLQEMVQKLKGYSLAKVVRLICKQHEVVAVDMAGSPKYRYTDEETGERYDYRITYFDWVTIKHDNGAEYYRYHQFYFNLPDGVNLFE